MVTRMDMDNGSFKTCDSCGGLIDATAKYCPFCGQHATVDVQVNEQASLASDRCSNCGEERRDAGGRFCWSCGQAYPAATKEQDAQPAPGAPATAGSVNVVIPVPVGQPRRVVDPPASPARAQAPATRPAGPDRTVAGILAILLGGLGVHKFYMGKIGTGILCVLFCWTGIPSIVGLIEGIIYLTSSDEEFARHHLR